MSYGAVARNSDRTKKLKTTINDLESALASWDHLSTRGSTEGADPSQEEVETTSPFAKVYLGATAACSNPIHSGPVPSEKALPTEVRKRTLDLLNQLKAQIDELSSEDLTP